MSLMREMQHRPTPQNWLGSNSSRFDSALSLAQGISPSYPKPFLAGAHDYASEDKLWSSGGTGPKYGSRVELFWNEAIDTLNGVQPPLWGIPSTSDGSHSPLDREDVVPNPQAPIPAFSIPGTDQQGPGSDGAGNDSPQFETSPTQGEPVNEVTLTPKNDDHTTQVRSADTEPGQWNSYSHTLATKDASVANLSESGSTIPDDSRSLVAEEAARIDRSLSTEAVHSAAHGHQFGLALDKVDLPFDGVDLTLTLDKGRHIAGTEIEKKEEKEEDEEA